MARLTAEQRRRLPSSAFVYPRERRYPIHDVAHARNALARAGQPQTSGSYATVARAVGKRWGGKIKLSKQRKPMARRT
jgi:hypothetical protein